MTPPNLLFIRGVNSDFDVKKELFDIVPMKHTTTGLDIFEKLEVTVESFNIHEENHCILQRTGQLQCVGSSSNSTSLK